MILQLNEKWRIESTPYAWAIARHTPDRKKKDGTPAKQWTQVSWHSSVDQAVIAWYERELMAIPEMGLEETLAAIKVVQQEVRDLSALFRRVQEEES